MPAYNDMHKILLSLQVCIKEPSRQSSWQLGLLWGWDVSRTEPEHRSSHRHMRVPASAFGWASLNLGAKVQERFGNASLLFSSVPQSLRSHLCYCHLKFMHLCTSMLNSLEPACSHAMPWATVLIHCSKVLPHAWLYRDSGTCLCTNSTGKLPHLPLYRFDRKMYE